MFFVIQQARTSLLTAASCAIAFTLVVAGCVGSPAAYNTVTVSSKATGAAVVGSYAAGTTITISAGVLPSGHQFKRWKTDSPNVIFATADSATTTFVMPANAVAVTAEIEGDSIAPNRLSVSVEPIAVSEAQKECWWSKNTGLLLTVLSYAIVFFIVTAIFVCLVKRKERDIDDVKKRHKKLRDKLQQAADEINTCDGIVALRKTVGKVRTICNPYYGYAYSALNDSVIGGIITELNNEPGNDNLESLKLKTIQNIDCVSNSECKYYEQKINDSTRTRNAIIMAMVDFFLFSTCYLLKSASLYLLSGALIINAVFVYILWKSYEQSKETSRIRLILSFVCYVLLLGVLCVVR